jgi:hypothetical protein
VAVEITFSSANAVRELAWSTVNGTREQWIGLGKHLAVLKGKVVGCGKAKSEWYRVFGEDSKRKPLKEVGASDQWPFGSDTADKLIAVAQAFGSVENSVLERLPASWGTLYVLSSLPAPRFKEGVSAGDIRPNMTRADAKALSNPKKDPVDAGLSRKRRIATSALTHLPTRAEKLSVALDVLRDAGCTLEEIIAQWKSAQLAKVAA